MVLLKRQSCDFGKKAVDFILPGVDGRTGATTCMGKKGLLVMFICNHCPYVKRCKSGLLEILANLNSLVWICRKLCLMIRWYPEIIRQHKLIAEQLDFSFLIYSMKLTSCQTVHAVAHRTFLGIMLTLNCSIEVGLMPAEENWHSQYRRDLFEAWNWLLKQVVVRKNRFPAWVAPSNGNKAISAGNRQDTLNTHTNWESKYVISKNGWPGFIRKTGINSSRSQCTRKNVQ